MIDQKNLYRSLFVRQRLKNFPEIDDLKFNKFIEPWCYMKEQFHSYL